MVDVCHLTWDPSNVAHIARHGVTRDEVEEICHGEHVALQSRDWRPILIGPARTGRFIAAVIEPEDQGAYYVVTARPASRRERTYFRRQTGSEES